LIIFADAITIFRRRHFLMSRQRHFAITLIPALPALRAAAMRAIYADAVFSALFSILIFSLDDTDIYFSFQLNAAIEPRHLRC
jgi:hypothetical protein